MQKTNEAFDLLKKVSDQKCAELTEAIGFEVDKVKDAKNIVTEKVRSTVDMVNESAHTKPWHYIAGALVVGVLLGILTRSRK